MLRTKHLLDLPLSLSNLFWAHFKDFLHVFLVNSLITYSDLIEITLLSDAFLLRYLLYITLFLFINLECNRERH